MDSGQATHRSGMRQETDSHLMYLGALRCPRRAFERLFFGVGDELLLLMVLVFGISTLLTYSYYGVKCFGFLTRLKWGNYYNYFYIGSIIFSSLVTVEVVVGVIDLSFALMCIPNMISVIYLSPLIRSEMKERQWI